VNTLYAAVGVDWYVAPANHPGANEPDSNPELVKHEYGDVVGAMVVVVSSVVVVPVNSVVVPVKAVVVVVTGMAVKHT